MKIRIDYVTNSSSSSYALFGFEMWNRDLYKIWRALHPLKSKVHFKFEEISPGDLFNITDDMENLLPGNMIVVGDYETEYIMIGRELSSIRDKETGKEFRDSTKESLEKIFPEENCSNIIFTVET